VTRRAVLVALGAIAAAGIVAAVLTRTNDSAARASSLDGVVSQVRTSFGDNRIVRAKVDGSTLHVVVAARASGGLAGMKSAFEVHVLAAAVADWMRLYGEEPIAAVRYADLRGDVLSGANPPLDGEPVPADAGISSLGPGRCRSVAEASVRSLWGTRVASVEELPYLHGTCVVRIRSEFLNTGVVVMSRFVRGIGDREKRPWFIELDDGAGTPQAAASWMPGLNGSTWARAGIPYPFAHL
jgi:hypothetical protein